MTNLSLAIRYPGSKKRLANWIISYMPPHRLYCEPYGGSGAVMMEKPRSTSEIYNDLDDRLVNLFRVLQCPEQSQLLYRRLRWTPFSRREYEIARTPSMHPVIDAQRLLIHSWMGFGGYDVYGGGFRSNVTAPGHYPATNWQQLVDEALEQIRNRMMGVTIESRPACDVMQGHDTADTLFYVDPPYPLSVRHRKYYRHELTSDDDHEQLADVLHSLNGMVILSGYDCDLYQRLYPDWQVVHRRAVAQNGSERVETLWLNPAVSDALEAEANAMPPLLRLIRDAAD